MDPECDVSGPGGGHRQHRGRRHGNCGHGHKESRRIGQRMNSYAINRIAETLRVLLFMTLAILIFNFYPLTAVMIVMLALLNDGAILSIGVR